MQTKNNEASNKIQGTLSLRGARARAINYGVRRNIKDSHHKKVSPVASPNEKDHHHPPASLIEAWVWMWQSGPDKAVRSQGKANLMKTFGSIQGVINHIENR